MGMYIVTLKFDNNYKLPLIIEDCKNNAEALTAATHFCNREGYYPIGVEVIKILSPKGVVCIDNDGKIINIIEG